MSKPTRGVATDAIPRFAVRFDDGNNEHYWDALHFLERGIPVGFSINWTTLRDDGPIADQPYNVRMRKGQIRDLISIAKRNGTTVSLISHGNTNWSQEGDVNDYTYAQMRAELEKQQIEDYFGIPVTIYLQPGGGAVAPWCHQNRELIKWVLEDLGFQYAIGLADLVAETQGDSLGYTQNDPVLATGEITPSGVTSVPIARPGLIENPYDIPDAFTIDIGTVVVTRGVVDAGNPPLPDPNSGAPGWLLGEDNNGAGAEGSKTADWDRTWVHFYMQLLAIGSSAILGLHGENRTNTESTVDLSTGTALYPRHMNYKHVAWTLRRLANLGHIQLVSPEDFCQYIYSDWAPAVDLISNPQCRIPHVDVGDLSAGHYFYPRGFGTEIIGINSFSTTSCFLLGGPADADGDQLHNQPVPLTTICGPDVVGVRGFPGGFRMKPTEDTAIWTSGNLNWQAMSPGRYRFSIFTKGVGSSHALLMFKLGAVAVRWRYDSLTNFSDPTSRAARQEYGVHFEMGYNERRQQPAYPDADEWTKLLVAWECPKNPTPCLPPGKVVNWDPGSIADAGTDVQVVAVTGAVPGARVMVMQPEKTLSGLFISAEVTDLDEVTLTLHNETGAPVDPDLDDVHFFVEKFNPGVHDEHPLTSTPYFGTWKWNFGLQLSKQNAGEGRFSLPRLEYYPW